MTGLAASGRGLTLTELLIVILILGILAAIGVPSYAAYIKRAKAAACKSQLRTLHSAFGSYMLDHNQWPQMPELPDNFVEADFFGWWIKVLSPYGISKENWVCPSDKFRLESADDVKCSYMPTLFDFHNYTPHRWNQPWLIERGDFHGKGAHLVMPDGSIHTSVQISSGF